MQVSQNLHFQVILQVDLRWPLTLISDLLTTSTYEGSHTIPINHVWFQSDFNFSNEAIFTFSAHLITWPQMTFGLGIWPWTAWIYEGSHIISVNQVWFQSDFNFSNEAIFTFSDYLTTWPQMTFDLGIWPLTAWTYESSHIISINQVWFQSDFNFSNEAIFTFSAYLTTWPQMTFDHDVTFDLINKWGFPCCIYDPTLVEIHQSMWKVEPNVNLFLNRQQTTYNNNINRQRQLQWTKWSLCVFPPKEGDTKSLDFVQ